MRYALLIGFCLGLAACGDTLALHPLVSRKDAVREPALEGSWREANTDHFWKVRPGDGAGYELVGPENDKFGMRLTRIDGVLFADVWPADHSIPGHMFIRLELSGDTVKAAFLDSDWLRERIRATGSPAHTVMSKSEDATEGLVLTGSTAEMREFVGRYAHVPHAFEEPTVFQRVP